MRYQTTFLVPRLPDVAATPATWFDLASNVGVPKLPVQPRVDQPGVFAPSAAQTWFAPVLSGVPQLARGPQVGQTFAPSFTIAATPSTWFDPFSQQPRITPPRGPFSPTSFFIPQPTTLASTPSTWFDLLVSPGPLPNPRAPSGTGTVLPPGLPPAAPTTGADNYLPPDALRDWYRWLKRQRRAKRQPTPSDRMRLRADISRAFKAASEPTAPLAQVALQAIAPHREAGAEFAVDWDRVAADLGALRMLIRAYEAALRAQDEQDAMDAIRWLL